MKIQCLLKILFSSIVFSGCAVVDKTLVPVDNMVNKTKSSFTSVGNSTDETMNDLSSGVDNIKADFYENTLVKFFSDDKEIIKNREKYFIKWDKSSNYDSKKIINNYLRKNNSDSKEANLDLAQKMKILKDYFFDSIEKKYLEDFQSQHKIVEFDPFLTDRENIEKIYNYKNDLLQSEHHWNMNINSTQKKIATLILSTVYATPKLEFISYNPYDEEIFLLVKSSENGFKAKVKFEVEKKLARRMKANISTLKPSIYYKIDDDSLEFVGISIVYNNQTYLADLVDTAYTRKSDIVFTSKKLNLKKLDVDYTEVISNIEPPEWYLTLQQINIGYGQGISLDEARTNAYKNIAQSKKVKVNTESSLDDIQEGSLYSSSIKNKTNLKSEDVVVKNTKTIKEEKKDGIWFVAISY